MLDGSEKQPPFESVTRVKVNPAAQARERLDQAHDLVMR
jgi:hypothetical protein